MPHDDRSAPCIDCGARVSRKGRRCVPCLGKLREREATARRSSEVGPNPSGLCACGCGLVTPIAADTDRPRGKLKGHHRLFAPGHQGRPADPQYAIDPITACWVWQRGLRKGYGRVMMEGRRYQAHVYFYQQRHGPVAEGQEVDHLCKNRACVNPDHLEAVTHAENIRRGDYSGNGGFRPFDGWARHHSCCADCGTTERPHYAKGLCHRCYYRKR